MLNLDTHILIHALKGDLTREEERLLTADAEWSISAIVLWELAKLVQLKRVDMDLSDPEVVGAVSQVLVWPITLEISIASTQLDVASDPADELIAATSLVHGIPLVTRDARLRKSKRIPLAR